MGRKVGSKNKFSKDVKSQILAALDQLGGVNYLVKLGKEHPPVFGGLLGRVLPMENPSNTLVRAGSVNLQVSFVEPAPRSETPPPLRLVDASLIDLVPEQVKEEPAE